MKFNFSILFKFIGLVILLLLLQTCKRIYDNPYDPNTNPDSWKPKNIRVEFVAQNLARISWEQDEERIDGFKLVNLNYPSSNPFDISKEDSTFNDSSLFIAASCGPDFNYSLRAYAGNNESSEVFYDQCLTLPNLPFVTTSTINGVTSYGAVSGGEVSSFVNATVNARGVCWSTNSTPTIADSKTVDGTGTGYFTSTINGLNPSTTYYLRAYATNINGTGYGDQIIFTTDAPDPLLISTNSCNNLTGINSELSISGAGTNCPAYNWTISSSGYSGSCLISDHPSATGSCQFITGGFIEFQNNFNHNGYVEFWYRYTPPYIRYPEIYIDGIQQSSSTSNGIISNNPSGGQWQKIRTDLIPAGIHTIKFLWPYESQPASPWFIDEIEFWELI